MGVEKVSLETSLKYNFNLVAYVINTSDYTRDYVL